jgi:hypothetical protein
MPIKYLGVFTGIDLFSIAGTDNDEYRKDFFTGKQSNIDTDVGVSIGGRLGLSLSYPFNNRFTISSDIGLSYAYLIEGISGQIKYQGQNFAELINIESHNIGIMGSLFGSFRFNRRLVLTFGAKSEFLFFRKEMNKEINDIAISDNRLDGEFEEVDFFGVNITPFIGLCITFLNNT